MNTTAADNTTKPTSLGERALAAGFRMGPNNEGIPEAAPLLLAGRDRDLNNDGLPDPGADMWTADVFHTRDMVRQSVLEQMQFVRILRHMDGETLAGDGGLLGDVDGDGDVDLGGPHTTLGHWGISLGGVYMLREDGRDRFEVDVPLTNLQPLPFR